MAEEPREIGRFAFWLRIFKHSDGNLEYKAQSVNDNMPIEIVIMQLKAFLNNLEKEYFNAFEKGG